MKVLHITRDFAPRDNGGLSRGVETMVRMAALARPDLEQAVLSFDGYRPRRAGPAELVVAKGPWGPEARLGGVGALADARDFARRFEPEVVHVHHAMLWPFAREALPAAPAVFGLHVLQRAMGRLRGVEAASESERLEAQALEEAAVITVPSVFCRSQLATTRAPVIVWPLAHHDTPEARAEAERDHPSGTPDRLLYVGRFADVKGIVELLAAMPRVTAARPGTTLVLAGGLPDNPKAERRWRRRAEAVPGVEVAGWLDRDALRHRYAESALLVAPSWIETYGLAVQDAMAHGLAVVASATGALVERVTSGETGWLVAPRDSEALADALIEACRDVGELRRRGRAAARSIRAGHLVAHHLEAPRQSYALALESR